jgi:L-alanine-DL-glutamate epimerase-like enolase superfamily enzyme
MEIMVDANQANVVPGQEVGPVWSPQRAIWTAKAYEALGVTWLEEPLSRYDFAAIAGLCETVQLPIAGGENNRDMHDFVAMIKLGAYDIFQPDVMVAGIANCRKVAGMAKAAGKLAVGHHGGTGLGMIARLHLNASCANAPYIEYFYDPPKFTPEVFQGIIAEPIGVDPEGYLRVPEKPGLGVELNADFIERYRA